jgi:magnesium transporter
MIRVAYRDKNGNIQWELGVMDIAGLLEKKAGLLWVDMVEEPAESARRVLGDIFGFHPLAVDDALEERHVPKIDDWGDHLYTVLHAVRPAANADHPLSTVELDLFVSKRYVVSYQSRPISAVDRVWAACSRDDRQLNKNSANLLYLLADELVNEYLPVVEEISTDLDAIEDEVFATASSAVLAQLFTLKRATVLLRRIMFPQREVLNKLARGDFAVIAPEDRVLFRDVYDHLVRLHDMAEGLRDLSGSVMDTYLSVVNNRMNEVMKTLTLLTTLFMPLTFLTGFFGMNFFQPTDPLPTWTDSLTFEIVMVSMALIPLLMFFWMRRRAWA